MAIRIVSCEGAVFAVWGKPTMDDVEMIVSRVQLVAKTSGRRIVYITRVPGDAPAPEPNVRQRLNEIMPIARELCTSYHVILEGTGFVSALKRAILAGLMQLGWPRGTFFVHASYKTAPIKVPLEIRPDAEAILAMAEAKGMLTGPAPVTSEISHEERPARARRKAMARARSVVLERT
ncbi:MAG: hypothetical protein JW940_10845 [Polyangiaceae bacterium]|nr:hypothetical protein [Polyangiaceae bacterium]